MVRNSKPMPATNLTSIINSSTQTKMLKTSAEKSYQSTNSNYLIRSPTQSNEASGIPGALISTNQQQIQFIEAGIHEPICP